MIHSHRPIFYDASGRRKRRLRLALAAFGALLALALIVFITSIVDVEPQPLLQFEVERPTMHAQTARAAKDSSYTVKKLAAFYRNSAALMKPWFGEVTTRPLSIAFHAPWDDSSAASLSRHINDIDWLIPAWVSITGADHTLTEFPDLRGRAIISAAEHPPLLVPMIQNAINGKWDGKGMAALLADPAQRKLAIDHIETVLRENQAGGAFFDLEELPATAQPNYKHFLSEVKARFEPHGWVVAIAAPVDDLDWDLKTYAKIVDKVFLMAYDEHSQESTAGPIASTKWFVSHVAAAAHLIPREKLVIAFGNYAYDWVQGDNVDANGVEEEWLSASESEALPVYDPESGNSHFDYDENNVHHEVWMLDAASAYTQLNALRSMGFNNIALWRLGTEDPSLWKLFGRNVAQSPAPKMLEDIPAGTNVDVEGSGEILKIASTPISGIRRITTDNTGTQITNVEFLRLPLPYQIQRTGAKPGLVALTFDDGPDYNWTGSVLDILKQYDVPATFFIIGENALTERKLLNRIVREGHEVGSHTYTHPNLGKAPKAQTELELNATQRLFQAYTGHSLRLFRAPFFGDAEPTTADEIIPINRAQQLGYLSVGLHVDPGDWKRPGVDEIIDETVAGVTGASAERSGNIVLLHDSGGNREQTIAALPEIITQLREKGYRFVRVSELAGLSAQEAMPAISGGDRTQARIDLFLFDALGSLTIFLGWLFKVAITVGIARAVVLSCLALRQARREAQAVFPLADPDRLVTVLIPAYNEANVITWSIRRILESTNVHVDIIVIDDGSVDGTSEVVRAAFADEARVRLITLENGGKARALNEGLKLAKGDIVVALDADTQFEPTTISRLARWFVDPNLGAVAGNAKVGNRINLVTRWQALEYITAQNLERRAFASLNAMTVVPGAVGAWRLQTLREVGGYPVETLAEDQDLTIAIQRVGWRVHYDQYAVAWTEAPENFRALAKQRFRWAFGTLQCLWKHRGVMRSGNPAGLAFIGLPQVILFQILFAAISPIIDLALIVSLLTTWLKVAQHGWAQTSTDIDKMLFYWLVFTTIDLLAGVIAFALERKENWRLLWLLIPQRFGYRQVMYYVVLKAIGQALHGLSVGWGKLERSGRVLGRHH